VRRAILRAGGGGGKGGKPGVASMARRETGGEALMGSGPSFV
jgi:hypothetical protein